MPGASANLLLPYLASGQAQKHVTVNESLRKLDAIVQLSVESASTSAEPGSPSDGQVYILPPGKTGTHWGAMADHALAYWRDGAWEEITPREGWLAFVRDADALMAFTDAAWSASAARAALGLGTAAVKNTGVSGDAVPLLGGANIWGGINLFANPYFSAGVRAGAGNYAGAVFANSSDVVRWAHVIGADGDGSHFYLFRFDAGGSWAGTPLEIALDGSSMQLRASVINVDATSFRPAGDNSAALGGGANRWSTVYAATGAINTSDAREKTALAPIPEGVKRAARRIIAGIGVFQWRARVEAKGESGARLHVGVTAQAVREAFAAEGEDPARWALFCEDAAADGETRLGLRPDQLHWLALAAL